jgi:3-hydroxyacyl-CoA dehydrogenase
VIFPLVLQGLADADYVIEAVSENEPLKRAIFQRLDLVRGTLSPRIGDV